MSTPAQLTRATMIGPFPLPDITDDLRAEARGKPGEWIAFVDPAVKPDVTNPPKFAVQGGYHVDETGQLSGQYHINPGYEPSQIRAGFGFANGLELTLWRVLHGYNPLGLLADSFYHAELLAYAEYEGDTRLPLMSDPTHPNLALFAVCTSPQFTAWEHTHPVEGDTVLDVTGTTEAMLDINPGTSLSLRVPARDLAGLINDNTRNLKERYLNNDADQ